MIIYSWFVLLSETEGVRDVTDKESLSENDGAPFCLFPADSLSHVEQIRRDSRQLLCEPVALWAAPPAGREKTQLWIVACQILEVWHRHLKGFIYQKTILMTIFLQLFILLGLEVKCGVKSYFRFFSVDSNNGTKMWCIKIWSVITAHCLLLFCIWFSEISCLHLHAIRSHFAKLNQVNLWLMWYKYLHAWKSVHVSAEYSFTHSIRHLSSS